MSYSVLVLGRQVHFGGNLEPYLSLPQIKSAMNVPQTKCDGHKNASGVDVRRGPRVKCVGGFLCLCSPKMSI